MTDKRHLNQLSQKYAELEEKRDSISFRVKMAAVFSLFLLASFAVSELTFMGGILFAVAYGLFLKYEDEFHKQCDEIDKFYDRNFRNG